MCALHDGQMVEVAAPETCCLRLHSKHSTTELVCRFQKSSNLPKMEEEVSCAGVSSMVRSFRPGFGANGEKERPHCRQIELFAAAYSICLKPQCGHSALTFAGDGLATGSLPKPFFYARAPNAALIGSLDRTTSGRVAAFVEKAPVVTSDFPIKVAPSSITRRAALRLPCNTHLGFELAALGNGNVTVDLAIDGDPLGFSSSLRIPSVFTDC